VSESDILFTLGMIALVVIVWGLAAVFSVRKPK